MSADSSPEDGPTAASAPRKVFNVVPAEGGGWRIETVFEEHAETVPPSKPDGTATSSYRRQRAAVRAARRLARREPGGAHLCVRVGESTLHMLLDPDLRKWWVYGMVASFAVSVAAASTTPEAIAERSSILAVLGGLTVGVAVAVIAQAAFAGAPPRRNQATLRRSYRTVVARFTMLAGVGIGLLVVALGGSATRGGETAIAIKAGFAAFLAVATCLLLLSAFVALLDYIQAAVQAQEDDPPGH